MKKILTYILAAVLFTFHADPLTAQTTGGDPGSDGIHLKKTIESFDYSTFEGVVRMESYVEGEVKIISETQPQDIVLVLDVSTSMNDNMVSYSYTARTSQSYTYSGYGSNTYYYLHTDGNYYPVSRGGTTNNRRLYFSVNGTRYYLTGTTVSTSDDRRLGNGDIIWTGILYSRTQSSENKLTALKNAATAFINSVYDDAVDSEADHRISIVTFAENATTQTGLTNVTTGRSNMLNIINNLRTANWTSSDRGMSNAATVLNAVTDTSRGKDVILFTDGVPCRSQGSGNVFEEAVANGAITNSLALKNNGARVYAVGVFDNPTDQTHKYMNFVSSNYPEATGMSYTPYNGTPATGSYYMTARDSEELSGIFNAIAQSISGGASVSLHKTTELKDVFSSFCSLQADASGVTVKLAPCIGCSKNNGVTTFTWGEEIAATDTISYYVSTTVEGESFVDIIGFDYSENWCGLMTSGDISTPHGYKLVAYVEFKLNVTPELQDVDPIYSNTSASGLYNMEGDLIPGGSFDNPIIRFGRIIVRKNGLKVGDSAIFKVTKGTGSSTTPLYDIVVTGKSAGTAASTIIPLLIPNETYTVTENTDWGWTYSISDASRSQSKTFDENGGTVTFTFENSLNEYPLNSEKAHKGTL